MKKILVYRIGSLGDNLVAVPAIRVIRNLYPQSRIYLLSDQQVGSQRVQGREIYEGSGLFDGYLSYPFESRGRGRLLLPFRLLKLAWGLRQEKFDALVYLPPTGRPARQVKRDLSFFKLAGIGKVIGAERIETFPPKQPGIPLPMVSHESDFLLARLKASGIQVPPAGQGDMELNLGEVERKSLEAVLSKLPEDGGRPWVGVGPGSKQSAKVWPEERFREVVSRLIREYGIWPVVFGGGEDKDLGDRLVEKWGRGYNLASLLSVRGAALALKRCNLYLGNDTGTMHLAAAVKTPCAAVFCSHAHPGRWYPYGSNHRVLRVTIECEGCGLAECLEKKKECILSIGVDEVAGACREILERRIGPGGEIRP